jgi:hypothetical protein
MPEMNVWTFLIVVFVGAVLISALLLFIRYKKTIIELRNGFVTNPIYTAMDEKITKISTHINSQIAELTARNIILKRDIEKLKRHYIISILHASHRKTFQNCILSIKKLDRINSRFVDDSTHISEKYIEKLKTQFIEDSDNENIDTIYQNKVINEINEKDAYITKNIHNLLLNNGYVETYDVTVSAVDSVIYRMIKDIEKKLFKGL